MPACEQAAYLREQLRRKQEAHAEARRCADTLLARLMDRMPELEAPQEPPGGRETGSEEPGDAPPRPDAPSPQTGAPRRPWWRRVFGS